MSIIHEALKKVQSNKAESKTLKQEPKPDSSVPVAKIAPLSPSQTESQTAMSDASAGKKPPTFMGITMWSFVIFALCSFTFYNLYQFIIHTTEMAVTKYSSASVHPFPAQNSTAPATPIVVTAESPKPIKIKKGEILLSGIVMMDGKDFALINKEFYEVGETVEGAKITKITDDGIEILQRGKARTIKVIRPE